VLKIFCPALTSLWAHAGLPIPMLPKKMQPSVEPMTRTLRAQTQPLRDPLTLLALGLSVLGFLELRCLTLEFTWRAIGASRKFSKCYLPTADFAT
jgi:hypothetical protein